MGHLCSYSKTQVVPESAAWQKQLQGEALEARRLEILHTHSTVLGSSESFRPRKKFRQSVEKCFNMWDNQVRLSVHPKGLWWFSQEAVSFYDGDEGSDSWPGCTHVSDQGGDMMSLVHASLYFDDLKLNMWEFWDPQHGCTRDFSGTAQHEELKPLIHLLLMAINLPHGPEDSDYRYKQIVDFMSDHFIHSSPCLSPLFRHMYPELLKECQEEAETIRDEGESMESAVWRVMQMKSVYKKKGNKAHIGRYGAVPVEGMRLLKTWNQTLFQTTVPAVEGGMINKKAMTRVKLRCNGADDASQVGTGTKSMQEAERTLRSCGVNAMVVCMCTLSDPRNKRLLAIMAHMAKPVVAWSNECNRELRKGVLENQQWLLAQLEGSLYSSIHDIFGTLLDPEFLQDGGFVNVRTQNIKLWSDEEIQQDDEFATVAGRFCTRYVMNRQRRTLYLFGHPHSMTLVLSADCNVPKQAVDDFLVAKGLWQKLHRDDRQGRVLKTYKTRCSFNRLANTQLMGLLSEKGATPDSVKPHVSARTKAVLMSTGVEELNTSQKNSKQSTMWGGRYRRPQTCLAVTVRNEVLWTRHKFLKPPPDDASAHHTSDLTKRDLTPMMKPSLNFQCVSGSQQKAPYFSPNAEGTGLPTADMAFMRVFDEEDTWHKANDTWKGCFVDVDHQLVFRFTAGSDVCEKHGQPKGWLFAMYHYKDSSCMVWPVELVEIQGVIGYRALTFTKVKKPQYAFVHSWDHIECAPVEWHGWPWQFKKCVDERHVQPGIRAFIMDFNTFTPTELGATNAWWSFDSSTITNIAQHLNADISSCEDTFSKLFTLTKAVLGDDAEVVHQALQKRIKDLDNQVAFADVLMEVDEAAACLVEQDRHDLTAEQDSLKIKRIEFKHFKKQYKESVVKCASDQVRGGGARRNPKFNTKFPSKVPDFNHIQQSKLKTLVPEGSLIWRNRTDGAWCGRYKTQSEKSCRDSAWGGEPYAALAVLRHIWSWWCDIEGYEKSQVPMRDLWEEGAGCLRPVMQTIG